MSKKKLFFKSLIGWADCSASEVSVTPIKRHCDDMRVRVSDACELTPEKAVEMVLQHYERCNGQFHSECVPMTISMAAQAGMSVSKKYGVVRVRKANRKE